MQQLVLFAKRPRRGRVKTRLVPRLGEAGALELYRAILADQIRFLRSLDSPGRRLELCLDEPCSEAAELAGDDVTVTLQGDGDLGRRLDRCASRNFSAGVDKLIILGADAPTLPAARVAAAWTALDRARAVLNPAEDGGYVLIGLSAHEPELFREIPWGGDEVLERTIRRARDAGTPLELLEPWYDVDRPEDLIRLAADLCEPGTASRAPETARALARLGFPVV